MDYTNSFPWATSLADFYTQTAIPNAPKHTGRLPLSDRETRMTVPPAVLFAPEPSMASSMVKENIQYKHSNTSLNEQFFSPQNVDVIQGQIRATVASMVNAQIDRQSDSDLLMVMRSYYLTYAQNMPGNEAQELKELNDRVVAF
jgi:hypothetical protein